MKTKITIGLFMMFNTMLLTESQSQWNDQNSDISNTLNDVFFINESTGWAVGRNGKIIHTTDNGTSWAEQNSGTSEDLNKVFMLNASVGYAVGENGTVQKYDGTSWATIDINFSQDMAGVYFLDENTGWISGDWGRIMYTDNGGDSWSVQMDNSTFSNYFMDLHMISPDEGWAVGTSGKVLKWDGSSWSGQSTPASDDLESVHFNGSDHGFISGDNAKIYHYDGSSWSEHSTGLSSESYTIKDVHVIDQNNAYAAVTPGFGGGGIILQYNGTTWSIEYENTDGIETILFYGIHMIDGNTGYAVGAGGLIKTKNEAAVAISPVMGNAIAVQAAPNPAHNRLDISFDLPVAGNTKVVITDLTGKRLIERKDESLKAGHHQVTTNISALTPGIYLVKINTGYHAGTIQIVKPD